MWDMFQFETLAQVQVPDKAPSIIASGYKAAMTKGCLSDRARRSGSLREAGPACILDNQDDATFNQFSHLVITFAHKVTIVQT